MRRALLRLWLEKAEKALGEDWERCDEETGRECPGVRCCLGARRALVYLNRAIDEMNSTSKGRLHEASKTE